jgi:hypothetical protein
MIRYVKYIQKMHESLSSYNSQTMALTFVSPSVNHVIVGGNLPITTGMDVVLIYMKKVLLYHSSS